MMSELFKQHTFPIIGGICGLILAILFLSLGFFKTILVLLLIAAGSFIGMYLQRSELLERFFPDKK